MSKKDTAEKVVRDTRYNPIAAPGPGQETSI